MLSRVFVLALLGAQWDHAATNPLYQELYSQGVLLTSETRLKLPQPTMADGLDAAAQQEVLASIIGQRYPVEEFIRDSVVAPFLLKFPDAGRNAGARGVDLWFVAHGDLAEISKDDVLKEFTTARGKEATLHVLTSDELLARKLPVESSGDDKLLTAPGETGERFVHTTAPILEKVDLHQTLRCVLSRSDESIVIATIVDHRFDDDREFPNLYHRLVRDEFGEIRKSPAERYGGAGGYLKATRLVQPAGAILVEYHSIFSEPHDWFNGANLLQSKLPILLQSRVRDLRRELQNQ